MKSVVNAAAAAAAVGNPTFDSLRLGRSAQSVVGRLIRFWDSRNVSKNGEFMGITILLLDELDSVIHCFIPANRANHYRSSLKTGSIVRLDRFDVARVGHTYKITEHQYVIRFIPSTRVVEVQTDAPVIKMDKFMVRRYEQLQVLANTSLELPDVVGEIKSVQGSDLKNQTATSRVVVRLLIEPNVTVFMSLWDEAASAFRGLLKAGDKSQSVMLVTTVNPKLFGGNLYLNSTQGTRFFFDTSISEIAEFVSSIGATQPQDYTCVDTLEGVKKKELVSIRDLNTFISNSNEQTQEADFLCKAQIIGVIQENGWFFVSCTGCHKKLEKRGTSLDCSRCATSDVTGVVRFRVELAVDDGKDSATFVVFDKEMNKLTKQEAAVLALDEVSNGGEEYLPSCLEELAGKEFVFQIRVTPFNFTPNHRTFTVATISEDSEAHSENSGVDTGLESSSSGPSVLGVKISEERASGNNPGNAGAQQRRKRGRE
ncbi:uncharacterized protein LOC103858789 [Brassica rapa]|uniref:uncharacterized protein LOC103858789 n=1 Tax=Brassica campestris TaxID=3711 RepID=UPI00142D2260|nr:uncharacterized protein LOC103858789 [Brassica rapa]